MSFMVLAVWRMTEAIVWMCCHIFLQRTRLASYAMKCNKNYEKGQLLYKAIIASRKLGCYSEV